MKRKTLGKLFAVTAAGLISANAPIMAEAKEQQDSGALVAQQHDPEAEDEQKESTPADNSKNTNDGAGNATGTDVAGGTAVSGEQPSIPSPATEIAKTAAESGAVNTAKAQTTELTDQTEKLANQTGELAELTTKLTAQSGELADLTGEQADQTGKTTDLTEEKADQTGKTTDLTEEKADQAGKATDPTVEQTNQAGKTTDLTGEQANQTGETTDLTSKQANQTEETIDLTSKLTTQTGESTLPTETNAPTTFEEAAKNLTEAEEEAGKAQEEVSKIQEEIIAIQTGIPDAQKEVERTNTVQKQAATEQTNAEEKKTQADAAVTNTAQDLTNARNAWNSVIDNAGDGAAAMQEEADQLQEKRTALLEAENKAEELEAECAARKTEASNAASEKNLAESSVNTKEEFKNNADKAVSNAQADLAKAQREYDIACEAEKSQDTESTKGTEGTDIPGADGSEENIDEIVNALNEAKKKVASGSLGFFQYLAENENNAGAKAAVAILTSQDGTGVKGLRPLYLWQADSWEQFYSYTHIGEENDATSLENMKRAIEFMEECNQLRENDDNFPNCEPLTVNDAVMAIAQLNANWATYVNGSYHSHSAVFNTGENLAWYYLDRPGSDDPFKGWYDLEKIIYDSKLSGVTGHYLNITNKEHSVTGFGVNLSEGSGGYTRMNCAQEFIKGSYYGGYGFGSAYSVAEYRERFNQYYYKVMTELSRAQAAYDKVSGIPGAQTAEKRAALYQAQENLESAKANALRAQALLEQAKEDLGAKEQKYTAAMAAFEKSSQDLEAAKTLLEQKNNAYQTLKQEIEGKYAGTDTAAKMVNLVDANASHQKALLTQEKATDTLAKAQTAYKEAVSAHKNAISTLNNLRFASESEKNQELKAAQERYAQAFEKLAIAQGYYDKLNPNQGDVVPSASPNESGKPDDTNNPSGTGNSNGTSNPSGTVPPNGTGNPNGTVTPGGTNNPNETVKPGGTNNPNGTVKPDGAGNPNAAVKPNGTGNLNAAVNSGEAAQLEAASAKSKESTAIYTALNQSGKAAFSKDCSFSDFVKISTDIMKDSASIAKNSARDNLTLDCSDTPWFSLTKKALLALKNNPDLKLTILFRYGGKKYTFTIPAGFDFDSLEDSNGWYGFMYLKMIFGGHETE